MSWTCDPPLALDRFRSFVRDLPSTVFRAKGFVELESDPVQRGVFQLVGKRSSIDFDATGAAGKGTGLVFITRDAEPTSKRCVGSCKPALWTLQHLARHSEGDACYFSALSQRIEQA